MTAMSHLRLCLLSTLLLFCIFASSFLTVDALVVGLGACRSDQIQALMEFKNEFDSRGCNHTDFVNGVRCNNATGAIKKLQLPSGCLRGTLKPNSSLFKLHHLRYLNLSDNVFTSSELPSGFGSLNKLEVLSLSSNGFVGQLPSSFSNLSQLFYLSLPHNELSGSLAQLGNLSKLAYIDLVDNLFSEALDPNNSLFRLHNLHYLNLALNDFTSSSFLSGVENLNKLEVLSLSLNGFHGQVSCSISNLSQLSLLDLSQNKLTGSFPAVQNLTKLSLLMLENNNFSGTIPPSLLTMPMLSFLYLGRNHFSGTIEIPTNSSFSSSLKVLDIGYNHFDAQILEPISKLTTLEYLDFSFQNISYPIDLRIFSSLKSLLRLDLCGNSLSPTSLSSDPDISPNLKVLWLNECKIREFPKFINSLQNLEELSIVKNKMKGKVPEWLWSLPRLTRVLLLNNLFSGFEGSAQVLMNSSVKMLNLGFNRFEGEIPILPLYVFSAQSNYFTGNIPYSVSNRNSLKFLDLSSNNLTGPIPQCSSNLEVLRLRKNNLEGSLLDMFYAGSLLQTLDVGYNRLTGKLPRSLVNCSSLKFLNVDNNKIQDTFPFWLKTSTDLHVLTLRSNRFFGQISPPDQEPLGFPELSILEISDNNFTGNLPANYFENWKAPLLKMNEAGFFYLVEYVDGAYFYTESIDLRYKGLHMEQKNILTSYSAIDFSGNRIEGQIPESIGQIKTLIALNLSNNAFTGHIPTSLGNAKVLESLDLSGNQLSGSIPNGLGALSSLAYINVSHNQLTGEIPQGTQIVGQPKSSFEGNAGLCGLPLEQSCFGTSAPPTQHHIQEKEEEDEEVLNWKAVTVGYASGVLLGMALGKAFASYKPEWLVKRIGLSRLRNH